MKKDENIIYKRVTAPVKFYSRDRGYGFCKGATKQDQDIFFSSKNLERSGINSVKADDLLEFDLLPVPGKGGKAINIRLVK